jgi:hypothetical protein
MKAPARYLKLSFACSLLLLAGSRLDAIEADSAQEMTARLNYSNIATQSPAMSRNMRSSFGMEYLHPIGQDLRVGVLAQFMFDNEVKTRRLDVAENIYWFAPTVEISYPRLFRFALQAAPTYVVSSTTIELDSATESVSHSQLGLLGIGRIEYVIHPLAETGVFGGYHLRLSDEKSDLIFGVQLAINLSAFGRSTGGGDSSPSRSRRRRG